ncbi:MAG: hypothetical protein NTZ83_02265 [Candidatus Pacearchaeota archaeon]|nr:hypothetical protein [Candidatus Pacearchaeota archaeon]
MKITCCFCGNELKGSYYNPAPLKIKGSCCKDCSSHIVIPTRTYLENKNYKHN